MSNVELQEMLLTYREQEEIHSKALGWLQYISTLKFHVPTGSTTTQVSIRSDINPVGYELPHYFDAVFYQTAYHRYVSGYYHRRLYQVDYNKSTAEPSNELQGEFDVKLFLKLKTSTGQ